MKNPETDIGAQIKIRKAKAAKLLESSYLFEIFKLKDNDFLSHPSLYPSLVLESKAGTASARPLWLTIAAGIKAVCSHCLACMAD